MTTTLTTRTPTVTETVTPPRPRDVTISAIVLGVAAFCWSGWAMAGGQYRGLLAIVESFAVVVAALAIIATVRAQGPATMSVDARVRRVYLIAVVAEVAAILLGAFLLGRLGLDEYIAAWTLAVVAAHFVPLARAFVLPTLNVIAGVAFVAAAVAVVIGAVTSISAITLAGGLGALVLSVGAVVLLVQGRRRG